MKKKVLLLVLFLFLFSLNVLATVNIPFQFNFNQVYAKGYTCHDTAIINGKGTCLGNQVDQTPFGYNPSSPATTNGKVTISFMNWPDLQAQAPGSYQFVWFFVPGYRPIYYINNQAYPCSNCNGPTFTETFTKYQNCKSEVGNIQFSNNIYSDQPIVVSVPTNLSADTSAAFGCITCEVHYYPSQYINYFSVQTDLILSIKNSNNQIVHTQTLSKNILWNTTESVSFTPWTPSTPDTYTVTVTTHVTDDQCANVIDDSAASSVKVWSHYPKDECWTDIQGLTVQNPDQIHLINQPLTISFQKRSQYAPNYDPWESEYNTYKKKLSTITSIFLGFNNDWQTQDTRLIPASGIFGEYESVEMTITPQRAGSLKMKVNGTAQDAICTGKPNTLSSEPTYYDIDIKECVPGTTRTCYSGPSSTLNIGECKAGLQTCDSTGKYSACIGQVAPTIETCDAKDNDCDGTTDENCNCVNGNTTSCNKLYYGICSTGQALCVSGQWTGCPSPRYSELCGNELDDDCNNLKDCEEELCRTTDWWVNSYPVNPCTCTATEEICDGQDNDCDGVKDNVPPKPCTEILSVTSQLPKYGVCLDLLAYCTSGKMICDFTNYELGVETSCDNLDNDCDGAVDENIKIVAGGIGACSINTKSCINGTFMTNNEYSPQPEICGDNIDNDCNGEEDETCFCNPGETKQCGLTETGECSLGNQLCGNNRLWGSCNAVLPADEICDGKDNNCDTIIDNAPNCCENGATRQCFADSCNIPGLQTCTDYQWEECDATCPGIIIPLEEPIVIETEYTTDDAIDTISNEITLSEINITRAEQTGDVTNQSLSYSYEDGKTKVDQSITTTNELENVDIMLYLPKDCVSQLDKLHFFDKELQDYKIIKEDPLIAWHFAEVKDRIDISYDIEGKISEDCLKRIKMLPIAGKIGKPVSNQPLKFLIPFVAILLIASLALFLQHSLPEHKEEGDPEKQLLSKQIKKSIEEIKSMNFKSKDDAEAYMKQMDYSDYMRTEILKRL